MRATRVSFAPERYDLKPCFKKAYIQTQYVVHGMDSMAVSLGRVFLGDGRRNMNTQAIAAPLHPLPVTLRSIPC